MPIIDGIKMACEPCIRGHRSTKCNHASERIMIPVRKPGRPLSVCPHPTSNGCSCSTVTAALPRTKKCGCGSKSSSHSTTKQQKAQLRRSAFNTPVSSPLFTTPPHSHFDAAGLPPAVASPMASPIKNGWSGPSAADDARMPGDQPGGQYSLDAAGFPLSYAVQGGQAFGLRDTSFPYGYATQSAFKSADLYLADHDAQQLEQYFGDGGIETPAPPVLKNEFDNVPFDMKSVDMAAAQFHHLQMMGAHGRAGMGVPPNMHTAAAAPMPVSAPRAVPPAPATTTTAGAPTKSCCGQGPRSVTDTPPSHTPTSSTNSLVSTGGGSLVSNSAASSSSSLAGPALFAGYLPQQQTNNGAQTWASYRAELGTVTAPLQQSSQWIIPAPHMMPGIDLSSVFAASSMPMNGASAMQGRDMGSMAAAAAASAGDAQAHLCECGDGCECVGCVVHPFNQATRSTIQAAWSSMMIPATSSASAINAGALGGPVPPMAPTAKKAAAAVAAARPATSDAPRPASNGATPSPTKTATRTPSEASGASDEQMDLPPDDFLFVSYSFMGGCEGESQSCPCGDDCQCMGCTVHNNPRL